MEGEKASILRVENLSVKYGGVKALSDVSLEVSRGELVGLIGPNGAGKTTLLDAVTGFTAGSGEVYFRDREISSMPPHKRARLGLTRTWQAAELFDDLSVGEHVAIAAGEGGDLPEPLATLGIGQLADALPAELSQGQRKLVGVARALAGGPELVCLDEPAAGLDSAESRELGARLRELTDRGLAMLLIDHDMGLVLSICDRVVVLEFGRVIADGRPEQIRANEEVIAAYLGKGGTEVAA